MKENEKNVLDLETPEKTAFREEQFSEKEMTDPKDGPTPREPKRDPGRRPPRRKNSKAAEKKRRLAKTNRQIKFTAAVIAIMFLGMIGYMGYFLVVNADSYRNSSYNSKRQALLAEKYERGDILAYDGTVLATTTGDGEEKTRSYPQGSLYAHAVGYSVGGVTGLESNASSYLLDSHTSLIRQVANEIRGRKTQGDSIRSTLVPRLQKAAYDALGDNNGAVIVMEPSTGRVLAMVSKPDFDPNTLNGNFEDLDEGILVNRTTQGLYTPGSTFKIMTTLEYMRENPNSWDDFAFDCSGTFREDSYSIRCYDETAHGSENLTKAFAESCNGAFASIGSGLNYKKFNALCEEMGFNSTLGLGAAKSRFVLNNSNSLWNVLQTSIGQGETQITPLLNCMIVSAIANEGVMMKPMMVDSVVNAGGKTVRTLAPTAYKTVMNTDETSALTAMMKEVCDSGTGTKAKGSGYTAYGKTGSAEIAADTETNAWFVGWADADKSSESRGFDRIAVSIVVEESGSGGSIAAPIAKKIFEEAFK